MTLSHHTVVSPTVKTSLYVLPIGIPNPPSSPLSEIELQLLVQAGFKINSLIE